METCQFLNEKQRKKWFSFLSSNDLGDHTHSLVITGLVAGDWGGVEGFVISFGNPKELDFSLWLSSCKSDISNLLFVYKSSLVERQFLAQLREKKKHLKQSLSMQWYDII